MAGPHIALPVRYRRAGVFVEAAIGGEVSKAEAGLGIPGGLDERQNAQGAVVIDRSAGIEDQSRPIAALRSLDQKRGQFVRCDGDSIPKCL
ncbi:hypothetical protein ED21_20002 [Erythrobacter sp. SD-21]|nr:hypothetical protein ED21_20002 [Erythrobacter sp. SD-21]